MLIPIPIDVSGAPCWPTPIPPMIGVGTACRGGAVEMPASRSVADWLAAGAVAVLVLVADENAAKSPNSFPPGLKNENTFMSFEAKVNIFTVCKLTGVDLEGMGAMG